MNFDVSRICTVCGTVGTVRAGWCFGYCQNPACRSVLLAPIPPGKRYVLCHNQIYVLVGQEATFYLCPGCNSHHIVVDSVSRMMNNQLVFKALSFEAYCKDLLADAMTARSQLTTAEIQNSALVNNQKALERQVKSQTKDLGALNKMLLAARQERDDLKNAKIRLEMELVQKGCVERAAEKNKLTGQGVQLRKEPISVENSQFNQTPVGLIPLPPSTNHCPTEHDASGRKRTHPSHSLTEGGGGDHRKKLQKLDQAKAHAEYEKKLKEALEANEKNMVAKAKEIEILEALLKQREAVLRQKEETIQAMTSHKKQLEKDIEEHIAAKHKAERNNLAQRNLLDARLAQVTLLKQEKEGLEREMKEKVDQEQKTFELLKLEKERVEQKAASDGQKTKEAYKKKCALLKQEMEREVKEAVAETHAYGQRMKALEQEKEGLNREAKEKEEGFKKKLELQKLEIEKEMKEAVAKAQAYGEKTKALYEEEGLKREAEAKKSYEKKLELLKQKNEKAIEDMKEYLEEKDEAMKDFLAELEKKDGVEKEMRKELEELRRALEGQKENKRFGHSLDKAPLIAYNSTSSEAPAEIGKTLSRRAKLRRARKAEQMKE